MADLTVTAANVVASSGAQTRTGVAGGTVTAGQLVYRSTADQRLYLADSNGAGTTDPVGVALHGASAGQPLAYVFDDPDFTPGATMVSGLTYIMSGTAGGLAPDADGVAGWTKCVVMVAKSTSKSTLKLVRGGVV
jgi:hypothetical protein